MNKKLTIKQRARIIALILISLNIISAIKLALEENFSLYKSIFTIAIGSAILYYIVMLIGRLIEKRKSKDEQITNG